MRFANPFYFLGLLLILLQCGYLSIAFASPSASGFSFGTSQALDRASVSVVRLVVTYAGVTTSGCQSSLTGLGVLVGSWPSSPGSNTFNNWVLTDGSLVDPSGLSCTPGTSPTGHLASIQMFASTAYTNAAKPLSLASVSCSSSRSCTGITCQISPGCSGGVALVPFSATVPQPFLDIASASQGTPIGIELTGPAALPPAPNQASQFLAPTQAPSLAGNNIEPGMPSVNTLGQLVDMKTKAGDTGGIITTFVSNKLAPAPLSAANTNMLHVAWDKGVTEYYGGNSAGARTDLQHARTLNSQFQAPSAFLSLLESPTGTPTGTVHQPSNAGGVPSPAGRSTILFGLSLPNAQLFWLVLVGVLLLAILFVLLSLVLIRRQVQYRQELARFEEEQRSADQKVGIDAVRTAELEQIERQQEWRQQAVRVPNHEAAPASLPMPNVRCPKCGQLVKTTDKSCPNCLFPLPPAQSALSQRVTELPVASPLPVLSTQEVAYCPIPNIPSSSPFSCPNCHHSQPPGAAFCGSCGFSLSPQSENQTKVIAFPPAEQQRPDPLMASASVVPVQPSREMNGEPVPEARDEDEKAQSRVGQQMGNYQLVRLLGEGGFAEVYLGQHIHLGSLAAIKVLHSRLNREEKEKFRTEARTIVRLLHPHIVRILEFGIEDTVPFLVMDYAEHGTLRKLHPRGARLPLALVKSYVKQAAEALQFAHQEKVIHRDIKPENMLVGRHDEILLSDFGIAVLSQSSRYASTLDMAGTIAYMAPEQIQGKPRPSSDQYALGIVTYEWLCGQRPFQGSFAEVASQHVIAAPPSLCKQIPALSPVVEKVVLTALAKSPKERFESIQGFATALEEAN